MLRGIGEWIRRSPLTAVDWRCLLLQELRSAIQEGDLQRSEPALNAAAWLLEGFVAAIKQHGRILAADLNASSKRCTSLSQDNSRHNACSPTVFSWTQCCACRKAPGEQEGGAHTLGASVDFAFFTAMMIPVLSGLQATKPELTQDLEEGKNGKRRRQSSTPGAHHPAVSTSHID